MAHSTSLGTVLSQNPGGKVHIHHDHEKRQAPHQTVHHEPERPRIRAEAVFILGQAGKYTPNYKIF